ncbi:MAG: HAD family hydrolase [Phycisphaerae bacterium]
MIEAVLFDIGDTLLHFETSKAREFLDAATRPGYERLCELGYRPPAYHVYVRAIRRAFQWAYLWSRVMRREVQIVRAFERCHRRMGIHLDNEQLNDLGLRCTQALRRFLSMDDDAVDVVARLDAAGFKLGIVSNTPFPSFAIDDFLQYEGLLDHFPVRIYSSDVRYMKPHRKIFHLALDQLGVAPARTLFIGDRVDKDVKGPARVGMKTALLTRNGQIPRGRVRPDHIIHRLAEIPAILQA